SYHPQDNYERLAFLGACEFEGRYVAAARLCTAAFAADPKLGDDITVRPRYFAAQISAQAGCGRGTDGAEAQPTEQARWRKQAREWLLAERAVWVQALDRDAAATRAVVRKMLTYWREDPGLACVRDVHELDKLADDERQEYLAFWADVNSTL